MLTFLADPVVPMLQKAGVKVGLDYRLVPLGSSPDAGVHFADFLARVAMMFGGVTPGDAGRLIAYAKERARAFVVAFPGLSDAEVAFTEAHPEQHQPQFIIFQCGADSLEGDPLAHLRLTEEAHAHAARRLMDIADRHACGRVLAVGGGGYNRRNLARAWTRVLQEFAAAG